MNITHVGPTLVSFPHGDAQHSVCGRILSLALAADGVRLYAGTYAGVWRSDDSGHSWRQLVRPQPGSFDEDIPGALDAPEVFDLAVSPVDRDLVLAGGTRSKFLNPRNGIYRSTNGGETWTLVHGTDPPFNGGVSQIVFAPDDPNLVFAAIGGAVAISTNAGMTWVRRSVGGTVWHVAVAPLIAGRRRVYAAGDGRMFCSIDGGVTWRIDPGANAIAAAFAGFTADNSGSGAFAIAIEPGNLTRLYLAGVGASNGPSYYARRPDGSQIPDGTICNLTPDRQCGEGSIWYGNFDAFDATGVAQWSQLPGPPVYFGGGATPSGNSFVIAKPTASGFLLFFADQNEVHVCSGKPSGASSWHRLDGKNASQNKLENDLRNRLLVHCDPHALVVTADFDLALAPASGVPSPYDQNSVLVQHLGGTIWMANDGGVHWSNDGGQTWNKSIGLETLDPVNIAGVFGFGSLPALYMGCGDNDDYFSLDGGQTWGDPFTLCGDCDTWFADVAQPTRVLEFDPRGGGLQAYTSSGYPDPTTPTFAHTAAAPRSSNASSGFVLQGYRPIIRTLPTELPTSDGDYVFIGNRADGMRIVLRTTQISSIVKMTDWDDPAKAQQVGAVLPPNVNVVQAAGGHANPVFYVSDGAALFRLDAASGQWVKIVPGGPPGQTANAARRFFVNPFDANTLYVLDDDGVKVSLDGGATWLLEISLTWAITAGGRLTLNPNTALLDMLFARSEPFTRFVFGHAGVACTVNGTDWRPLLSSLALPGRPESGFFDAFSDPFDRKLYVTLAGRSVLRLDPIPAPRLHPPPVFGMLELAAVLGEA